MLNKLKKNMCLICQTPDLWYIFHTAMFLPGYEIPIGLILQRHHSHWSVHAHAHTHFSVSINF